VIITHSFGKTFHATGWKIGYILAPRLIMDEFRKVHQYLVFSVNTPMQQAISEYIKRRENILALGSFYQEKRDYFLSKLSSSKFRFTPAEGSYFQLLDYSEISQTGDVELAKLWTIKHRIASIPVSVFYHNKTDHHYLRFCFAKQKEELTKAAEILCQI